MARRVWFALGLGLLAFGAWTLLFGDTNGTRPVATAGWAAGALIGHDGLLAPLVFAAGWLLRRALPPRVRAVVVPALVLAGLALLLTIPRWRSPAPRQNPSVWPAVSTVDIVAAVVVGVGALGVAHLVALLSGRVRRSSGHPGATGRSG